MLCRIVFVFLVGFVLVKSAEQGLPEITFKINPIKTYTEDKRNVTELSCDHNADVMLQNTYTVREGEEFKIITTYNSFINHFICSEYNNGKEFYKIGKGGGYKNSTTFKVDKTMGTLWNCTVLAHHNNPTMLPVVLYKGDNYSAANCFMKIHVRQTTPRQTILVNNMVLQADRTELSEKDVDFIAEYHYVVGDVVNITCINFSKLAAPLKVEYEMAGTISDNSIMKDLESDRAITLVVTLHSGHNNSYMIITNTEPTDFTKVMVRFFMLTEYNHIVSININGMTIRPKLKGHENHNYVIEYKYLPNQQLVCEDVILNLEEEYDLRDTVNSYKNTDLIPSKQPMISFYRGSADDKEIKCWSNYTIGSVAEYVEIRFTAGDFPIDQYSLNMELPSNGTVMQLYNGENKLKVIFYEFEDNETLQLKCGPLRFSKLPGPVVYLQFDDSVSDRCNTDGCSISKTLHVTDQAMETVCYLKTQPGQTPTKHDKVCREIRVILRKRVRSTITTTTTTTTTPITPTTRYRTYAEISTASNSSTALPPPAPFTAHKVPVIAGAAFCIVIICVAAVIVKLRKRNHSQGGPHDRNYRNLQTPSEASIPASPPQWESNYAVPVDRRAEDTTYSVPCQEPALYSTPTPKNLRNKKQKHVDPRYAVLDVPNARGQKNTFKETDDPNYSEVYANRQEQCYAKVLPKSVRNKMAQDNNPYSYVTNEPAYANTAEPELEPMYCEPAKAPGATYTNLNNSHYANSNAQEYVEPTYCEPQKRMK